MKTIHLDVATDIDESDDSHCANVWMLEAAGGKLSARHELWLEGGLLAAQLHFNHFTDLWL